MLNFLCDAQTTNNVFTIVAVAVLLVLMVVYIVFGMINRKKSQEQAMKLLSELKVGDKVVTNAGIYGEIVSQRETNMGKVVTLKTGYDEDEKHASFITVNAQVILGKDEKQDLLLDENGNVIEPEVAKEKVLEGVKEDKPKKSKKAE